MRTIAILVLGGLALVVAALRGAEGPPATSRSPAELKELSAVEQFLGLSDAELDVLQQVLARIRAMKPAERAALQAEILKYRQLPEPQREEMRRGWGWMPREVQDAWREMMQGATAERRTEIQTKMQAMEPDARLSYRRQLVDEYLKSKDKDVRK
jgi:hypothetical protein